MIIIKSIKLSGIKKSRKFLNRLNFKKIIKIILINFIIVVLIVSVILAFGIKLLKGKFQRLII